MQGRSLDLRCGALQIKKGPATGGTGYIIRLENPAPRRLQNIKAESQTRPGGRFPPNQNGIPNSITKKRPNVHRRPDQTTQTAFRRIWMERVLQDNRMPCRNSRRQESGGGNRAAII